MQSSVMAASAGCIRNAVALRDACYSLFHISLAAAMHLSATTNFLVSYGSLTVL